MPQSTAESRKRAFTTNTSHRYSKKNGRIPGSTLPIATLLRVSLSINHVSTYHIRETLF